METLGLYGLTAVVAVVIGVGLRFCVYTLLVKNNRWLPEKATKVANIISVSAVGLALLAIFGNMLLNSHVTH